MRKITALLLSMLTFLLLAAPAAAAPAPGAYGVVTDQSGRTIPRAEIELYQLGTGLVNTVTADELGGFRIPGPLQAGPVYQLRASAPGYTTEDTGWINLTLNRYQSIRLQPLTGSLQVTLRDDQDRPVEAKLLLVGAGSKLIDELTTKEGRAVRERLAAGEYRLMVMAEGFVPVTRAVTVSPERVASTLVAMSRTGFTLSGEVRDSMTDRPIGGASVELLREDFTRVASGAADGTGHFRVPVDEGTAGTYKLRVAAPGFRSVTTQAFAVAAGQEKEWSGSEGIELQPLTGYIAGSALKENSDYLPGRQVTLEVQGFGEIGQTTTSTQGLFRFEDLIAGPGLLYRVHIPANTENLTGLSQWTSLLPGAPNQVLVRNVNGYKSGTVDSSISGVAVTPAGTAVVGAKVELINRGVVFQTVETDADGAFLFSKVTSTGNTAATADPYTVRISKDGFFTTREVAIDGVTQTEFQLAPRQRAVLRAVLRATHADLRGRLTDRDGKPLFGASVRIAADGEKLELVARTDKQGWYSFEGVEIKPGRRFTLRGSLDGFQTVTGLDVTDAVFGGQPLPTLRLPAVSTVFTGQVLDGNGQPVAGSLVWLYDPEGKMVSNATSDSAGVYRMKAEVPQTGQVTLVARQNGLTTSVVEVPGPIAAGTVTKDLVLLPSTAVLEGHVLMDDGSPAALVKVELLEVGRGLVDSVTAGPTGAFRFDNLQLDGSSWYWLRVQGAGIFAGSLRHGTDLVPLLRLVPGDRATIDLVMKAK